jgi:hypothetical protein
MIRIESLGVALMMVILITVGCGSTQTKSPVMLEGAYRFSNIVTESILCRGIHAGHANFQIQRQSS